MLRKIVIVTRAIHPSWFAALQDIVNANGIADIATYSLWETRRHYVNFAELAADLRQRKGRSLLHLFSEMQLEQLIHALQDKLVAGAAITEKDRWTLWLARSTGI